MMEVDEHEVYDVYDMEGEEEEEDHQIQIPDSFPIRVSNSSCFEGKGVFAKKALTAGEELWEEDPLFSWTIRPDPIRAFLIRHRCGKLPLLNSFLSPFLLLFNQLLSSVKHPQAKRRKVVDTHPLTSPQGSEAAPSLVFRLIYT